MARLTLQLGSALVVPFPAMGPPSGDWRRRAIAEACMNVSSRRDNRYPHDCGLFGVRLDVLSTSYHSATLPIGDAR